MNYPTEQRQIFKYFDGEKHMHCDPLATYRDLFVMTRGKPNDLVRSAKMKIKPPDEASKEKNPDIYARMEQEYVEKLVQSHEAQKILEDVTRRLFHMKPFDPSTGKGADSALCMAVWHDFADFMTELKKKQETEQTAFIPTAGPLDTTPTTANT
jgi:hypothetical protein